VDTIPDVTVTGTDGAPLRLRDLPRPLIVYFYPKDDTPGCTHEALDFSALASRFAAAGASIIGISRDTVAKHNKFIARHGLGIPLGSDLDGSVTEAFGVWGERQMYGRTYMGIERATFLYGPDGRLVRAWRKVKVPGHAEEVLEAAHALG
jgi:thioredoxin-dependent peroxiredoxin